MENLTTQDSLKIIQTVIDQQRRKYEENGIFLILWGILIAIAGITQFTLTQMGYGKYSGLAWLFTMIPGAIISFIVGFKKNYNKAKNNKTPDIMGWIWAFVGILALITGFLFGNKFGYGLTAMIYIPFCIVTMASALSLKNYLWITTTIIATIVIYSSVFIPMTYHPIIVSIIALLLFLLPGIQLFIHHKKRKNV